MKIIKTIFDRVFSFTGFMTVFMTVFAILLLLIFSSLIKNVNADRALAEATTKACYDGGLIKVDTDAGFYCVAPANLVKVKVN